MKVGRAVAVNFDVTESVRGVNNAILDKQPALDDEVSGLQRCIQRLHTDVRGLEGEL